MWIFLIFVITHPVFKAKHSTYFLNNCHGFPNYWIQIVQKAFERRRVQISRGFISLSVDNFQNLHFFRNVNWKITTQNQRSILINLSVPLYYAKKIVFVHHASIKYCLDTRTNQKVFSFIGSQFSQFIQ